MIPSPWPLTCFALFGSPDPKMEPDSSLDLAIQTEQMDQMQSA
jgi:hypothetical protein